MPDDAITLKEYTDKQLAALRREMDIAMAAAQLATSKSEQAIDYRLAGMNEFRATLTDQTATFATRNALMDMHAAFEARLEAQRQAHDTEIKSIWKVVWALSGALAAIQAFLQIMPSN